MNASPSSCRRPVQTWLRLGWPDRVALAEAMLLSIGATAATRIVAFRRLATWMGETGEIPRQCEQVDEHPELVRRVRWAIDAVQRRVPWTCNCFGQALMARWMLGRRHIAGVIHFGLTKKSGQFEAHAWVCADGRMVTGAIGLEDYATVSTFSFRPMSRARSRS